jgi:hypothetical protein
LRQSSASSFKKQTHSIFSYSLIQTLHPHLFSLPPGSKNAKMSSNCNFIYIPSGKGRHSSDFGSSSSTTGRQLRSSTRGHDTTPASQKTQGDSQVTPPNAQNTIHLSQDRMTAQRTQSGMSGLNAADVDINLVLRAITAAPEAQRGPDHPATQSMQCRATSSTVMIAE